MFRVSTLFRVRFSLVIVAGLVTTALLITGSTTVSAGGATYTGTTATGAPVSITVNADRTAVTEYHFGTQGSGTAFLWSSHCGAGLSYQAWFQPIPISSGSFSQTKGPYELINDLVVLHGTFFGAQVTGTIAMVFPDFTCNVETSWTATTTTGPTPHLNGDVDCNHTVTIGDAQKIARSQIGLSVSHEQGCPEIGQPVP